MAERSFEEVSDDLRIPSVHSSYHGSFFLLRTPVTVHGAQAHVTLTRKRSPTLTLPFCNGQNASTYMLLSSITNRLAKLLQKYGVYHMDTFYYEDVPLFSVAFDSETAFEQFILQSQSEVRDEIRNVFAEEFARSTTAHKKGFFFPQNPPPLLPPVDVSVELYHIKPDHQLRTAKVELVALSSYEDFMAEWRRSELFTYHSIFTGGKAAWLKWLGEEKVLTITDLREVLAAVYEARKKWRWIGLELINSPTDLDNIQGNDNSECLEAVLTMWLKRKSLKPTWMKLVQSLKSKLVNEEGVACNVEAHVRQKAAEGPQPREVAFIKPSLEEVEEPTQETKLFGRKGAIDITAEKLKHSKSALSVCEALRDITDQELKLTIRDLPELQRKVHKLTEEKLEIEAELEARRITHKGLSSTVNILERKEKRHKQELTALHQVLEEKNFQISDLEAKLQQKEKALEAAENNLTQLEQDLETKTAELEKRTAEVIVLRAEVDQLTAEVVLKQISYEAEQKRIARKELCYEAQLKESKSQLLKALKETECKTRKSEWFEVALEKHSQEIGVKKRKMEKLQAELKKLKTTAFSIKELQASFKRETRILHINLQLAELRASLLRDDQEREKLQQERAQAVKEMEYLQRTIEMKHVNPQNCRATGLGLESAEKHKPSQFIILLYDGYNDPFAGVGDHKVTAELRRISNNSCSEVTLFSETTATYSATYTPESSGMHELCVKVNDTPIHESPIYILVINHPHPSNCTAEGSGMKQSEKHKESSFTVHLRDEDDESCVVTHTVIAELTSLVDRSVRFKGKVKYNASDTGTCEVFYTPTKAGEHELSVKVNGTPIHGSPFYLFVVNHPHPSKCTAEVSESTKKNKKSSFTVRLIDEDGELCVSTHTVTAELMSLADRSINVTSCETADASVVSYVPTKAGKHELSVKVNSTPIHGSPFRLFVLNHPHPSNCTAEGSGVEQSEKHKEASFTVYLRDEDGEPCVTAQTVTTDLISLTETSIRIKGQVNYKALDSCGVSYIPTRAGEHELSVKVNDIPIHGSPFRLFVVNHPFPNNCRARGKGLKNSDKHKTSSFTVHLHDEDGEPCVTTNTVTTELKSLADRSIRVTKYTIADAGVVSYIPTKAGDHELSVKVNDTPIYGSPFHLFVVNHPHPSKCTVEGSGAEQSEKHQKSSFIVHLRDEDGEPCVTPQAVTTELISLVDPTVRIRCETMYKTPDTCEVSYTPTMAGWHKFTFEINNNPIYVSPSRLLVVNHPHPDNCTAEGSGIEESEKHKQTSFTVHLRDEDGEPCVTPQTVTAELTSADGSKGLKINQVTTDTYVVSYIPKQVGEYDLGVNVNGSPICCSPFSLLVVNYPDPTNCRVEGSFITNGAVKNRSTSFEVHLRDKDGDPCVTTQTFTVEVNLRNKNGHLLLDKVKTFETNETNPHTYKLFWTPCRHTGLIELSVYVYGTPIIGSPFHMQVINLPHPSKCTAKGKGTEVGTKDRTSSFTIDLRDEDGEPCVTAHSIIADLVSIVDRSIKIECRTNFKTPGTCEVSYTPRKAGMYELSVKVNDSLIDGSPSFLTVVNPPHPSHCTAEGSGIKNAENQKRSKFLLRLRDKDCLPSTLTDNVTIKVLMDRSITAAKIEESKFPDTYEVSYEPEFTGSLYYDLSVLVNGEPIQGSPFHMLIEQPIAADLMMWPVNCIAVRQQGEVTGVAVTSDSKICIQIFEPHLSVSLILVVSQDGTIVSRLNVPTHNQGCEIEIDDGNNILCSYGNMLCKLNLDGVTLKEHHLSDFRADCITSSKNRKLLFALEKIHETGFSISIFNTELNIINSRTFATTRAMRIIHGIACDHAERIYVLCAEDRGKECQCKVFDKSLHCLQAFTMSPLVSYSNVQLKIVCSTGDCPCLYVAIRPPPTTIHDDFFVPYFSQVQGSGKVNLYAFKIHEKSFYNITTIYGRLPSPALSVDHDGHLVFVCPYAHELAQHHYSTIPIDIF